MKKLVCLLVLASGSAAIAQSDHYVRGYVRSDGAYVQPHMATNPNSSRFDNYSTQGNVNPYTGQAGTVNPYAAPQSSYGSGYNPGQRRVTGGW